MIDFSKKRTKGMRIAIIIIVALLIIGFALSLLIR